MGANAQTSVPTFTAGEVLTAANMNISARTGVPVFADTTARDAAFGGTGEKTLAEGQMAYVENLTGDAQIQYYDGSTWNSLGAAGLTLISSTTIGSAVSSVTVSDAFSSTYDNYKIIVTGGAASSNSYLKLTLGATTTGYYFAGFYTNLNWASGLNAYAEANAAAWYGGTANVDELFADISIFMPNLAKKTTYAVNYSDARTVAETSQYAGFVNNSTQYTAFTLTTAAGTMTGGTVKVYGYRN